MLASGVMVLPVFLQLRCITTTQQTLWDALTLALASGEQQQHLLLCQPLQSSFSQ
jgi:hypothetical protein